MEERHRRAIQQNFTSLVEQTDLDMMVSALYERGVFSEQMIEQYKDVSKDVRYRKRLLYMDVTRRGPQAFGHLLDALFEAGHWNLVRDLDPHSALHSRPQTTRRPLPDTSSHSSENNFVSISAQKKKTKSVPEPAKSPRRHTPATSSPGPDEAEDTAEIPQIDVVKSTKFYEDGHGKHNASRGVRSKLSPCKSRSDRRHQAVPHARPQPRRAGRLHVHRVPPQHGLLPARRGRGLPAAQVPVQRARLQGALLHQPHRERDVEHAALAQGGGRRRGLRVHSGVLARLPVIARLRHRHPLPRRTLHQRLRDRQPLQQREVPRAQGHPQGVHIPALPRQQRELPVRRRGVGRHCGRRGGGRGWRCGAPSPAAAGVPGRGPRSGPRDIGHPGGALHHPRQRVLPRPPRRLVVHPGAVLGVRGARSRLSRRETLHARRQGAPQELPRADLRRGKMGLQLSALPAPWTRGDRRGRGTLTGPTADVRHRYVYISEKY
ncbi:uncharacterized protein LOC116767229 isoform X2 [Danaus plexippus]|nr:uncharacterized protein LOC116767229 isoform X2 [Danaus plexippus]XP_061383373.1 uncharacterized protein LOC116767229 isoform X2 [Danaus plexippus]